MVALNVWMIRGPIVLSGEMDFPHAKVMRQMLYPEGGGVIVCATAEEFENFRQAVSLKVMQNKGVIRSLDQMKN